MATSKHEAPINRYYIDTRTLIPPPPKGSTSGFNKAPVTLPLLSTLPQENQDAITRFLRPEDKLMSLSSALLKFFFIHRIAQIPWSQIRISRTPKPHGRPFWDPPEAWRSNDDSEGLEFNVSHQAGLVILAGCLTPTRPEKSVGVSHSGADVVPDPTKKAQIRIGVDVTCTKEGRRTPDVSTQAKLDEWVDTFAEMFSERDRREMKDGKVPSVGSLTTLEVKARRFYTCWALKEAYIKMVGEGLLADWLRELEFVDVVSPTPGQTLSAGESGMKVLFEGRDVTESVEVEMVGFQETFFFTMITKGLMEKDQGASEWKSLDIQTDIRPCAEGRCSCLES